MLVAAGIVQAAMILLIAATVMHVLDGDVDGQNRYSYSLAIIAMVCAVYFLKIMEGRYTEKLGQDYVRKVRNRLFEHLSKKERRKHT